MIMQSSEKTKAGKRSATLDRTRAYMGDLMSFLVWSKETEGRLNLLEVQAKKGNEPPPHYHLWENEIFYLLEGEMEIFLEDMPESFIVEANEIVFIPKNVVHAVRFHTDIRMLAIVQATGEKQITIDEYFVSMSEPAVTLTMDDAQKKYAEIDVIKAAKLAATHGAIFLTPEETAQRLPIY